MKILIGLKKADYQKIKSIVPKNVEFIIWPNNPQTKKTISREDLNLSDEQPNCYVHFSGYKKLTPREIEIFSGRCLNIHPAPPEYPGIGGINWAIYNGDKDFGLTLHVMNQKIDQGKIIDVIRFRLTPNINVTQAVNILFEQRSKLLLETIENLNKNINFEQFIQLQCLRNFSWGNKFFFREELNKMQTFEHDENMSKKELSLRIRAFHTKNFPLKIKFKGFYFTLNLS